jgi:hypothetical protein
MDQVENTVSNSTSTVTEVCLPRRCVVTVAARATENTFLLLLRALPINGRCLQSRRLATGLDAKEGVLKGSNDDAFTVMLTRVKLLQ